MLMLLLACAPANTCEAAADAAYACADAAGVDTRAYESDAACPSWSADAEAVFGDWYACQEAAWAAADCGSAEGVDAASAAAAECPAP